MPPATARELAVRGSSPDQATQLVKDQLSDIRDPNGKPAVFTVTPTMPGIAGATGYDVVMKVSVPVSQVGIGFFNVGQNLQTQVTMRKEGT